MSDSPTIRRGTAKDSFAALTVMQYAMTNFRRQWGLIAPSAPLPDQTELNAAWERMGSLLEFLAANADQWWLAEQDGRVVGYGRSIVSDGLRELTELFVDPQAQAAGIGRELLSRAFPSDGARRRAIISSIDPGAQMLYMHSGVYPRFPVRRFEHVPEATSASTDLAFVPATDTPETLDTIGIIEQAILGYRRRIVHGWLLHTRQGFLCYRHQQAVGFGYVGQQSGPFAALEPSDLPALLAHAETLAAEQTLEKVSMVVPLVNPTAVAYLGSRRYQMARMLGEVMMDVPFGQFDRYVTTSLFLL